MEYLMRLGSTDKRPKCIASGGRGELRLELAKRVQVDLANGSERKIGYLQDLDSAVLVNASGLTFYSIACRK